MEVQLIPAVIDTHTQSLMYDYQSPQKVLKPLHALRNLEQFILRDADVSEIPSFSELDLVAAAQLRGHMQGEIAYGIELRTLVEDNTPIEFLVAMHHRLVSYTVAFERYEAFRHVLYRKYGWVKDGIQRDQDTSQTSNFGLHAYIPEPGIDLIHDSLFSARTAVENFDAMQFKIKRAFILENLEEKFQSIMAASRKMVEFIKEHKRDCEGLFRPRLRSMPGWRISQISECLVHLEDYNDALRRNPSSMPLDLKVHMRHYQKLFEDHYGTLPTDLALVKLHKNIGSAGYRRFFESFGVAFDDLDRQYLGIIEGPAAIIQMRHSQRTRL